MKNTLLAVAMAVALGFTGLTPLVRAAANDSTVFNMVKSAGALSCLNPKAVGRVSISDLGPIQNMHLEVIQPSGEHGLHAVCYQYSERTFYASVVPGRPNNECARQRRPKRDWDLQG